ncbi:MAG: hypothetical protein ACI31M_00060 [Bacilli bacterium]
MDKFSVIQQLKEYFLSKEEILKHQRMQKFLEFAIRFNDKDSIDKLLKNGASIQELDNKFSTIKMALNGFQTKIFNLQQKDIMNKYENVDEYYHAYNKAKFSELSKYMQKIIVNYTKDAISTIEYLYQKGANINHNTFVNDGDIVEGYSVFDEILSSFSHSKQLIFIEWILSKPELDLSKIFGKGFITALSNDLNPEAIKAVELLLQKGVPIDEEIDISKSTGITHNSLTSLLCRDDLPDRIDRFKILWKYSSSQQRMQFAKEFNLELIENAEVDAKVPKM